MTNGMKRKARRRSVVREGTSAVIVPMRCLIASQWTVAMIPT